MQQEDKQARRWTVADAIDFEHFVARADAVGHDDASWFGRLPSQADRAAVLRAWLERVRVRGRTTAPGAAHARAVRIARVAALVAGFVCGCGLVGGLLSRHESEPVNALLFFGGTVGIQLVVLLLAALAWLARSADLRFAPLHDATLLVVDAIARRIDRLDGEHRAALRSRVAILELRSARLAPLIGLQALGLTQAFAIAFNLGLLAAMLLVYLPFVELRFGWQSTYSFTVGGIDAWARATAAPWRWIADGLVPGPEQIALSRYSRGQPAATLPAGPAHAWWPFLLGAIAFYGLLVRIVLAACFAGSLRRRLARLSFASPAAHALWRRLDGPPVASQGGSARLPSIAAEERARRAVDVDVLVVDNELATQVDALRGRVANPFGVGRTIVATTDDDVLPDALVNALAARSSVVVAIPAARDPIVAIAAFLRAVVATVDNGAEVTVLLVDATDARATIWRRFVAIQRLAVGVEPVA